MDAVILSDPINIRYATGTRNMQVFCQRNAPSRYLLLTASRSILFEFTVCMHLGEGYETVDEVRPSRTASFVAAGADIAQREQAWAVEMADLISELVGNGATVGLERIIAGTAIALKEQGLHIVDAQQPLSSGQRTNPWFQETANRVIGENELIVLDTDVVGCHGYYSDFSRTFHSGPGGPTADQRNLYQLAFEQVQHNIGLLLR